MRDLKLSPNEAPSHPGDILRRDSAGSAEHELAAFTGSVAHLFGPDEARLAAIDWLEELESVEALPGTGTDCDWRVVSVAAAARLAMRLRDDCRLQALLHARAPGRVVRHPPNDA